MIICTKEEAVRLVKEATWLAYSAAIPMGAGWLHERDNVTAEEATAHITADHLTSDYIIGRMVKLWHFSYKDGFLKWREEPLRADYQSWCLKYPTVTALVHSCPTYIKLKK